MILSDFSISSWRLKKKRSWFVKTHNLSLELTVRHFFLITCTRRYTTPFYATNFNRGELNSKGMRWFLIKNPPSLDSAQNLAFSIYLDHLMKIITSLNPAKKPENTIFSPHRGSTKKEYGVFLSVDLA